MDDFGKVLAQATRAILAGAVEGVSEACDDLLSESRDEVPYDQGDLSNSGLASVQATPSGAHGGVGFDTPYAVRQHEDPTLHHQDGRKAQYLGDPLRDNADRYIQHIGERVRDALT